MDGKDATGADHKVWKEAVHNEMILNPGVAFFDVHYDQPIVCGNCVFLGQIQTIDETCAEKMQGNH